MFSGSFRMLIPYEVTFGCYIGRFKAWGIDCAFFYDYCSFSIVDLLFVFPMRYMSVLARFPHYLFGRPRDIIQFLPFGAYPIFTKFSIVMRKLVSCALKEVAIAVLL